MRLWKDRRGSRAAHQWYLGFLLTTDTIFSMGKACRDGNQSVLSSRLTGGCQLWPPKDRHIIVPSPMVFPVIMDHNFPKEHSKGQESYSKRTDFWFFHCYFPNYRIFIFQSSFLCFGFYMKSNIAVTKRKIHENEDGIHGLFLFIGILLFILDSLGRGYKRSPRKR